MVNGDTKAKGKSPMSQGEIFTKQMKTGDYFYLCRGNEYFELIGRIMSDPIECDYNGFINNGWFQREYE